MTKAKPAAKKTVRKTSAAKRPIAKKASTGTRKSPVTTANENPTENQTVSPPAAKNVKRTASASSSKLKSTSANASSSKSTLSNVAGQLFNWADKISDFAAPVANMSLALAKSQFKGSGKAVAVKTAGMILRQAREAVGMTAQEVGQAIDLKDAALLEQAETGKVALPFEVVLRLASVLGRHDPVSFAMKLTRSYNPDLWQSMETLGIGKLAVQAGREREFANIYRRRDEARRLNDKEFAALLALVSSAFDMGLEFRDQLIVPAS